MTPHSCVARRIVKTLLRISEMTRSGTHADWIPS
jgi:hypothetical protein